MDTSEYRPLLPGIGFSGYRSFVTWQTFVFDSKVTVLAGVNNSGKSNVLRFLQEILPKLHSNAVRLDLQGPADLTRDDLDRPIGFVDAGELEVGVPISPDKYKDSSQAARGSLVSYQATIVSRLRESDGYYWSRFRHVDGRFFTIDDSRVESAVALWSNWSSEYMNARGALGGGDDGPHDVMCRVMTSLGGFNPLPQVVTIGTRRVEVTEGLESNWLAGRGIIRALHEMQNPHYTTWDDSHARWERINHFLKTVLGDSNVSLSIPHNLSTIQVVTPRRVLPLSSMGGGIEQVIILAAAATVTSNSVVCIEEPETNLHPLLQKKLIRYLTDSTDNQYIIATHSSHLLDDARATAYHIQLVDGVSVARIARRPHELVGICNDLGYRPSDLLQANCVIWVEGPSDRTYIRRWIELVEPTLAEGIDYSVMFYGGKLLAHLTASEEALKDFIGLRQLNRASAIVIDSDRLGPEKEINSTKQRIQQEFLADKSAPGFAWVTECYTIENYVPGEILKAAIGRLHSDTCYEPVGQWENPLSEKPGGRRFDKVGIANAVVPLLKAEHLDVFDLTDQITALCAFIRAANGHPVAPGA